MTLTTVATTPAGVADDADKGRRASRRWPRRLLPSVARTSWPLVGGALAFFVVAMASHNLLQDSYFDLYAGRYVAHHGIPHHEVFTSAARGAGWVDQQWLAHLVYYGAWWLGGYPLFILLSAGLVAAAFALHLRTQVRLQVPTQQALIWTLLALLGCITNTVPRSQSFAYPLFVVVLAFVFLDSRRAQWGRRRLLIVPVLVVWANLHGSVLLGAAIVAAYAAWRTVRSAVAGDTRSAGGYGVLSALAAASPLATPYGTSVLGYYRAVLTNGELTGKVSEWGPPSLHDHLSLFYFVAVVVVVLTMGVTMLRRRTFPPLVPGVLVAVLLLMSTRAVRNEIWFVLAGTLLAAATRTRARPRASARLVAPLEVAGLALAFLGVAVVLSAPARLVQVDVSNDVLAAADQASLDRPGSAVLADERDASALLWLRPDSAGRVAFDIRFEQYPAARLTSYVDFLTGGPQTVKFASAYGVVLVNPHDHAATFERLSKDPHWRVVTKTPTQALLVERAARSES